MAGTGRAGTADEIEIASLMLDLSQRGDGIERFHPLPCASRLRCNALR
ncbi:hypothetical protein IGB42_01762 [Andreprevotia sp. IGB-42]|nr:hypothetical protein IGB42_01762 [Andreprevotia sp. IGB-42]